MRTRVLASFLLLALLAAACGGGDDSGGGAASGGGESLAELCPLGAIDALDASEKPVEITYWHAMTRENEAALEEITSDFNQSQTDVVVNLINQTSYRDNLTKFRTALGSGNLPDLIQIEDTATQVMVDSQAVVPAQACIDAEGYDTSDHLPRVLDFYTVEDVLYPMPFNVSNPVLYYNRALFEKAGLDPNDPPTTLDEVRQYSQTIVDSGAAPAGLAFVQNAWFLEHWLAMADELYANNGNGREARATEVVFDNDVGLGVFTWLRDMVDGGLLRDVGGGDGNIDHYLAVGNGDAAMTIDTSAALGTIFAVLGSGQFPDVELAVGPMPGPEGDGGVLVGGAANYILDTSTPAEQEAAWRFAKYLDEPDVQAKWSVSTGYVPIRQSAVELPDLKAAWEETPELSVAYEQLLAGPSDLATAGPVLGDFQAVRDAVEAAMSELLSGKLTPEEALAKAAADADAIIGEYNSRVG